MTSYRIVYNNISMKYHCVDEDGFGYFDHPDYDTCLEGASEFLGIPKEDIL